MCSSHHVKLHLKWGASTNSDCRYFFPVYELNCTLRSAISMKDGYKFKPDINGFSVFVFTSFKHPIARLGSKCQQHCQGGCSQGTSLGSNWCLRVWGVEGDRLWPHKLELLLQAMFVKLSVETEKSQTKKKLYRQKDKPWGHNKLYVGGGQNDGHCKIRKWDIRKALWST